MKIAIVHISDIHFKTSSDVGFRRQEILSNTIKFSLDIDETILFLVTGDIANTGQRSEYEVAENFFRPIFIALGMETTTLPHPVTFIPGNHDCNFSEVDDLRPRLVNDIADQLESLDDSGATVKTILKVQSDYFDFIERAVGQKLSAERQLFFTKQYKFGKKTLEIRAFNSAWLSLRHEEPGSLGFPLATIDSASAKTDAEIVISIAHHPANWLNPVSYQAFRKCVQENSDFLLTGHEHTSGGQVVAPFSGSNLIHLENGAFQFPNSGDSEFGILHLDLDERSWRHDSFRWSSGAYVRSGDRSFQKLFEKSERSASLQISGKYLKSLLDPGTGFLHPRRDNLLLSDIYIYPDLRTRSLSQKLARAGDLPKNLLSRDVPEKLLSAAKIVIAGPSDSGKTALAKVLYVDGNSRFGRTSLMLCGKDISGKEPEKTFQSALESSIELQYGRKSKGRFAALDASQRVLLIDNWHKVNFNRAGRAALLKRAESQFGTIILLVDDIFLIEELSGKHQHSPLHDYQILDIREFGFRLRGQMARKWHSIGNLFVEDEETFARHVADSTRAIDTVLGRNLLPSYPVNILTLLQTYDAGAGSQNSGLGSYGQVYEALITARLAKVSVQSIDIGTKITFLALFAWTLFDQEREFLNRDEWNEIVDRYYHEYRMRIDGDALRQSCIDASILTEENKSLRFTYGYGYCYFVAKYFQEHLADLADSEERHKVYARLQALSERVYSQVNANIVVFYVFLTKDKALINHVIANARKIFAEWHEFDFDTHLNFLNQMLPPPRALQLPASEPENNQQDYDQRRDESGEQIEPDGAKGSSNVVYHEALPFEPKLVIAIRYVMLMGQILRNFPGSLKAETKLDLAFESYSLGLRILSAVFGLTKRDSVELTEDILGILRKKLALKETEQQLKERAERIITDLLREVTFGLLKRLSHAVGLRELEDTYQEVSQVRDHSLSDRLINLSIKLDHFEQFPKSEINSLKEIVNTNAFSYQTLRDLVLNHLYLFPREYSIQQWAGSLLDFKVNKPEIRGSARKVRELTAGSGRSTKDE